MKNFSLYFTAKVATYLCNALVDAYIAEEVATYFKSDRKRFATQKTNNKERAQMLVESVKNPSDDYVIGLIYTLYYTNGLANYLYTKLLKPLIIGPNRRKYLKLIELTRQELNTHAPTPLQFTELDENRMLPLTYWPLFVHNSFHWMSELTNTRNIPTGNLNQDELKKAAHEVQRQNSAWNRSVGKLLLSERPTTIPTVVILRKVAQASSDPQLFLQACANTENAAARWDGVYTKLLK